MPAGGHNFWTAPRKSAARRWIWNIHFYAGLIAGLLWLVVGLTGSIIVFVPELRRLEAPGWSRVQPSGTELPVETLAHVLLQQRPGDRLHSIQWDFKPTWAVNIRTIDPQGHRVHSFVDQYRGTVLGSIDYNHSALQWVYDLHADLLGETAGRTVNAWFAFALALTATGGLLLWWRGVRYWRLGLEYRTKASWKRQTWDLHNFGGFLFYLPLLLLALTGAYYAYQPVYQTAIGALTGSRSFIPPPAISRSDAPRRSVDEIESTALAAIPDGSRSMINFPLKPGDVFSVRVKRQSDLHRIGLNWVYVDPSTARVLRVDRFDRQPLGVKIIRLMTPIHYGTIGGYTTRVLWIAVGLMPGVLFVTSLLMWWNRSLSKKWRRRRLLPQSEPELAGARR